MKKGLVLTILLVGLGTSHAQLAAATIGATSSAKVSPQFMGLSIEWCAAQSVMGQASTGTNTAFQRLIGNLTAYGAGPMLIRIGGNSTDAPSCVSPSYAAENVAPFAQLYSTNRTQFTLGVNLKSATLAQAVAQAQSYYADMPSGSVAAFEIGNEPDHYDISAPSYYANLASWTSGIRGATSRKVMFAGPSCASTACGSGWNQSGIAASSAGTIGIFTTHSYVAAGGSCATPYDCLLLPSAYSLASQVSYPLSYAHMLGMRYRVNEMNSLWNGGQSGVSDAFGSALWELAESFQLASEGVDGINLHGSYLTSGGPAYNPFSFTVNAGTHNTFTLDAVNPIYYGMLAFQVATANSAKIYPVTLTTTAHVYAWATIDNTGTERLVIDNLDEANSGNVTVGNPASIASVCYLSNSAIPSYRGLAATTTFAGQTFAGSKDGTIQGTASYTTLTPSAGVFSIPMAITQAAIVRFGVSTGC
jgi:hypothetical protein